MEDASIANELREKALFFAVDAGGKEVVEFLMPQVKTVDLQSIRQKALGRVAEFGHLDVVKFLLNNGASPYLPIEKEYFVLHIALSMRSLWNSAPGAAQVVRFLVENGASLTVKDRQGFTPLILAARYGDENILKFMLKYGAMIRDSAIKNGFKYVLST